MIRRKGLFQELCAMYPNVQLIIDCGVDKVPPLALHRCWDPVLGIRGAGLAAAFGFLSYITNHIKVNITLVTASNKKNNSLLHIHDRINFYSPHPMFRASQRTSSIFNHLRAPIIGTPLNNISARSLRLVPNMSSHSLYIDETPASVKNSKVGPARCTETRRWKWVG